MGAPVLAPLPRRVAAWLIDCALGVSLALLFARACGGEQDLKTIWHLFTFKSVNGTAGHQLSQALTPSPAGLSALRPILGLLLILSVIAVGSVAYRVVTTAIWGAGLGKSLLDLRIVNATTGAIPGWGSAWKRWAVPQVPGLIPLPCTGLIAYLPAFRDVQRRGLHDRAAGTLVVVSHRPGSAGSIPEQSQRFRPASVRRQE